MFKLVNALTVQWRVVLALVLRDTRTRFGRSRLGYFWVLFETLGFILLFALIFSVLNRSSPIAGADMYIFFFTGIIPWQLFSHAVGQSGTAIESSAPLLTYPQIKTVDVVIARFILEFATTFIISSIYLVGLAYFGIVERIESILMVVITLLMAQMLGASFGLVGGVIKLYWPAYSSFQSLILRILFFVSCIYFTADSLPTLLSDGLWYNPLAHLIEWERSAFFYGFESQFYDPMYPILWILCLSFLGLAGERVTRSKLRQLGV